MAENGKTIEGFEQFLAEAGITLLDWQREAARGLLQAAPGPCVRPGTSRTFLLRRLLEFVDGDVPLSWCPQGLPGVASDKVDGVPGWFFEACGVVLAPEREGRVFEVNPVTLEEGETMEAPLASTGAAWGGADEEEVTRAMGLILEELEKAVVKHPLWPDDQVYAVAIMAEEVGKAVRAANDVELFAGEESALANKLARSGAMAIRCLLGLARRAKEEIALVNVDISQKEEDAFDRLSRGRDYLMSTPAEKITAEDALEALGFGRNGLGG